MAWIYLWQSRMAEMGGFGGDTPPVSGILSSLVTSVRFVLDLDPGFISVRKHISIKESISFVAVIFVN